jgi:putative ABC transport system permease protein
MTGLLFQFWTMLRIALKRLFAERGLAIASAIGLTVSVALVMSIPLYADAVQFRILREQINGAKGSPSDAPLSFLFTFQGRPTGGPQLEDFQEIDQYISRTAGRTIGLPQISVVRLFRTDGFQIYPPLDPAVPDSKYFLTWVNFAFLNEPENNVRLVEGTYPALVEETPGAPVEMMISESIATEFGVQVGDMYFARRDDGPEVPAKVVGIWAPKDAKARYWGTRIQQLAIVSENSYVTRIAPVMEDELLTAAWFLVVDGSKLHAADIGPLLTNITEMQQRVETIEPSVELAQSQIAELEAYQTNAPALTTLLYAFSVPIIGLILAFVGLVAGLFVNQQRNEIAILRSRGATAIQVTGIALFQGLVLGGVALGLGIPLGIFLAQAIGRARSFLNFTGPADLRVSLTPNDLTFGVAAIGIILLIMIVIPTLSAAAHTIVTYKQDRARSTQRAWWQRAWLDVLLLLPAGYAVVLLNAQGSLVGTDQAALPDPLSNPLLLIAPALGIFAVTLLLLRLIPTFMTAISALAARTNSVGLLMAARYLSRTPAFYNAPMSLLVLTLSLSAITASLAQTLDRHLYRQIYYETGSDIRLTESGTTFNSDDSQNPVYTFRSLEDHLLIPGVRAASRVGRYSASALRLSGEQADAVYLGIDRLNFAQVAFWQRNFANDQLGGLLNSLGATPDGVLVSRGYMEEEGLNVGDTVTLGIKGQYPVGMTAQIVGVIDLFPSWYPEDGPLFVGNLDYYFSLIGTEYIHEVWMRTDPRADPDFVLRAVRGFSLLLDPLSDPDQVVKDGLNTFVNDSSLAASDIIAEQRRPERQGLFGLLSVGFGASALLTVLGFLLYALFSFRRRFIEMGMLRAIGLSARQMQALLASELVFLIAIGLAVGTVLGVGVSSWFIPYLQLGTATTAHYPPFVVEIAWPAIIQIYILFGLLFLAAFLGLAALLMRMKIFQAIKLGETA